MHRLFSNVRWRGCVLFTLVACVFGGGAYAIVALTDASSSTAAVKRWTPTAAEFGRDFVRTANAYAIAHKSTSRFKHPDCVQAKAGHYMCSYAIARPGQPDDCHLMQARWTPEGPSTFTMTLAGRTSRCDSLRAALKSLP